MPDRTCPHCATAKPAELFYRNRSRADGLSTYCKACTRQVRADRYRETIRASQQAWHQRNPEKSREYGRRWAAANPEKIRAKKARQVSERPEQYAAYARTAESNRRARELAAPGSATTEQVAARWAYYGGRCWMCRATATEIDHVKPLSRGGSAWPANLRPACRTCNSRKRARWPYPLEVARARLAAAVG